MRQHNRSYCLVLRLLVYVLTVTSSQYKFMGGLNYRLNSIPNNLKVFLSGAAEFVHVEVRP